MFAQALKITYYVLKLASFASTVVGARVDLSALIPDDLMEVRRGGVEDHSAAHTRAMIATLAFIAV